MFLPRPVWEGGGGGDLTGQYPNGYGGAPPFSASIVESAVRHLLSEILNPATDVHASESDEDSEHVLLDVVVDNVRCLLIRRPPYGVPSLSPRELQIATMVAQGYPNKLIASALAISSWTVSTHLRRIFAKMSVSSRASMVARLMQDGMRPPTEFGIPINPSRGDGRRAGMASHAT